MKNPTNHSATKELKLPIGGRDHLQGPITASLTLVEYGDYQCPYCGGAYPVVKAVQRALGDRLCFSFRNFPLTNMHPYAEHAAEAAEAAARQGHFWAKMHDTLFENQDQLADKDLADYASALGLDASRLMREVVAGEHTARVREDFIGGVRVGVNGTPTFFVNGERFAGPPTVEDLLAALTGR